MYILLISVVRAIDLYFHQVFPSIHHQSFPSFLNMKIIDQLFSPSLPLTWRLSFSTRKRKRSLTITIKYFALFIILYIYIYVCVCVLLQPIYYNSTSRSINETETKAVPVHRACNGGIRHVNLGALGVVPWLTPKLHSHCPLEPPWHEERSLPCARESRASAYPHDGVRGICD